MFTGIIQDIGKITSIKGDKKKAISIIVETALITDATDGANIADEADGANHNIKLGSSIACDGICLTATKIASNIADGEGTSSPSPNLGQFEADLSAETLSLTTAKNWQVNQRLNLEPSLKIGDELAGHFVSGHIDGVLILKQKTKLEKGHWQIEMQLPKDYQQYIIKKGSIALNGTSLTINDVNLDKRSFFINLIPHTYSHSNFKYLQNGDAVNFEIDLLARYANNVL